VLTFRYPFADVSRRLLKLYCQQRLQQQWHHHYHDHDHHWHVHLRLVHDHLWRQRLRQRLWYRQRLIH